MANPKVTICIPVYNVEKFIERCLYSVQNQTLKDIEIIVVDDCTPDNSMEIVQQYAKGDSRIKIINHDYNRGLMRARQTAYKIAKGDFICFCDSDDAMEVDALKQMYNLAVESDADIVSANATYIKVDGKSIPYMGYQSLKYGNDSESVYKSLLLSEYAHNLWAKLFKRELLQDFDYETFDDFTNGEDGYLFYQVIRNTKKVIHLDKIVYKYYQNKESSTQKKLTKKGIHSIFKLLKLRSDISNQYPNIKDLFGMYITRVIIGKYREGYKKSLQLDNLVEEYSLGKFISSKYILKKFGIIDFFLFWFKKNIMSFIIKK